jgi:hypothetical protein
MSTTVVFAELLVIGIQTAVWVALLVASLEPALFRHLDLESLREWEGLVTAALFALFYSLGVLVDRLADVLALTIRPSEQMGKIGWLTSAQSALSRRKQEKGAPIKLVELAFKEGKALEYLDYFRSRIRLTRALTINSILTTLSAIVFGLTRQNFFKSLELFILTVFLAGTAISIASFLATGMLEAAYDTRRDELERLLGKPGDPERHEPGTQNPTVAADA